MTYAGPLRDEPLSIELHNTIYADRGTLRDGLADDARGWVRALGDRLPGGSPPAAELIDLRGAVRDAVAAVVDGKRVPPPALAAINAAAARARSSARLERDLSIVADHGDATAADVAIAAIATDAIAVLGGDEEIHVCGAPGCVLAYVKDHPRREWCSTACGNRARQARHYARQRSLNSRT
jgi:predicted RNA-binding Zn ribbon-like protein